MKNLEEIKEYQNSFEYYLQQEIKAGNIDANDLSPIKCRCGAKDYHDKGTSWEEGWIVEKDRVCNDCGEVMGLWSYEHWEL